LRIHKVLPGNLLSSTVPAATANENLEDTMWELTTSHGLRVDGIRTEHEARFAVRMLGITVVIGRNSWLVVDNQGRRFVAEVSRARTR
jgi:hypothetical protein